MDPGIKNIPGTDFEPDKITSAVRNVSPRPPAAAPRRSPQLPTAPQASSGLCTRVCKQSSQPMCTSVQHSPAAGAAPAGESGGLWGRLNTPSAARGCSSAGLGRGGAHTAGVQCTRTRVEQTQTRVAVVHSSPPGPAPAPSPPAVGQRVPPCPRQGRGLPGSPSLAGGRGPACMGGDITGAAGPGARRQPNPADPHPPGRGRSGAGAAAGAELGTDTGRSGRPSLAACP